MAFYSVLLLVFPIIIIVSGIQQEISFYADEDQGGNNIGFRSSQADVTDYAIVLNTTKSYCALGLWLSFEEKNFTGNSHIHGSIFYDGMHCNNMDNGPLRVQSVRVIGPPNTMTEGLSIYETFGFGGREIFIEEEEVNFAFLPRAFASSGKTSWTFFEGRNFDGRSTCVPAGEGDMVLDFVAFGYPVYSARKDCVANETRTN